MLSDTTRAVVLEALEYRKRKTIEFGDFTPKEAEEELAELNAAIAEVNAEAGVPRPNNVPIYTNEQIDDIVDNHIFLDNGTSTYRVWEDRACKYLREMRDKYELELAFWQRYGVTKNLELVNAEAGWVPVEGLTYSLERQCYMANGKPKYINLLKTNKFRLFQRVGSQEATDVTQE